jgi:hypothetical protein
MNLKRLKRSAKYLRFNTLTSYDLEYDVGRPVFSTLVPLAKLNSTKPDKIHAYS